MIIILIGYMIIIIFAIISIEYREPRTEYQVSNRKFAHKFLLPMSAISRISIMYCALNSAPNRSHMIASIRDIPCSVLFILAVCQFLFFLVSFHLNFIICLPLCYLKCVAKAYSSLTNNIVSY